MFLKKILALLTTLSAFYAFPQTTAPISDYFNKNWERTTDPGKASYYRTIEQNDRGYVVRDYYISGKILMTAECVEVSPDLYVEGKRTRYYESGTIEQEGQYHNNEEVGIHKWYYENGKPRKEVDYDGDKIHYRHYWLENGRDELEDGEGILLEERTDKSDRYSEVKNHAIVNSYSIVRDSGDTLHTAAEIMPEYPGGIEKLGRDIVKNLKLPASVRKQKIYGTVYVQFIIGKDGVVRNIQVLKGINAECDEAATKAVSALEPWQPGMHKEGPDARHRPVAMKYVIPIRFNFQ